MIELVLLLVEVDEVGLVLYFSQGCFIVEDNAVVAVTEQVSHSVLFLHVKVAYYFACVDLVLFSGGIAPLLYRHQILVRPVNLFAARNHGVDSDPGVVNMASVEGRLFVLLLRLCSGCFEQLFVQRKHPVHLLFLIILSLFILGLVLLVMASIAYFPRKYR